MCTVTVIPAAADTNRTSRRPLVRLVCNRDEQRSRRVSDGPVRRQVGGRTAIMPLDPTSGGTWLGGNNSGLVACLLNANPPIAAETKPDWHSRPSRGSIVLTLLTAETFDDAIAIAAGIDAAQFPPFRALVITADWFIIASSDGVSVALSEPTALLSPILLTSSGLGDHLVESPRRSLFDRLLSDAPDPLVAQDRFHEHQWPDMPHLSVLMSRHDARTVCRSTVDLFRDSIILSHSNLSERLVAEGPGSRCELCLHRAEVVA